MSDPPGLGLAPLAVLPAHQRRGVGARLVEVALKRAKLLGYAYVTVLGQPEYYPRFGFTRASRFGLRYEQQVPDEVFTAQELLPGALDGVTGEVRYLPAFAEE
jgi:putative acetyltransferase